VICSIKAQDGPELFLCKIELFLSGIQVSEIVSRARGFGIQRQRMLDARIGRVALVVKADRSGFGVFVVVEEIVIHQNHGLKIGTIHDVVFHDRVKPTLTPGRIECKKVAAFAHIAPVQPYFGVKHLLNETIESVLEKAGCGR